MVPVLDKDKNPLMPTSWKRAKKLMKKGDAKPYWCKGVFCIILQREPKSRYKQDVCIGIDPGSKFNGYTVKSEAHTYINLQVEAPTHVKKRIEERTMLRRSRRNRKTPYRKCRFNRSRGNFIPPSTKARWQQHLNLIKWLKKMYNITLVAVEDVAARSIKGARKWNKNFSPVEVGKNWFYNQVESLGLKLYKFKGYETAEIRKGYGFKKNSNKAKKDFYTHCVDSWCIANEVIGGHAEIDNEKTIYLKPLKFWRRKLHEVLPKKNGFRRNYGGTLSMGIKRGSLVKHIRWDLCTIGGSSNNRISLHDMQTNRRVSQDIRKHDLSVLTNLKWSIKKI